MRIGRYACLMTVLAGGVLSDGIHAAEPVCSMKTRSEAVVLMHCPIPLAENAWIEAAQRACGTQPNCNVWIWDDVARMPNQAPKTDADIARDQAAAASAVWVNESKTLMRLKKVR